MIALGVVNVLLATVFVATPAAAAADARVFIESSMDVLVSSEAYNVDHCSHI